MTERRVDIWTVEGMQALCVTTNGVVTGRGRGVMGRGVALQAAERYAVRTPGVPAVDLPRLLGQGILLVGNHVQTLVYGHPALVAFPVKHHWRDEADLALIERSCRELSELSTRMGWRRVALPRPGCGNGGLTWDLVRPVCAAGLDDRFLVVHR